MLLTFPLMTRADAASSGAVEIRVKPIGLRLQEEFTRLWKEDVKVSRDRVTREFERYHTHYKSALQRMNMDESVSVQDDPAGFLRDVTRKIFQYISLKAYPGGEPHFKVKRRNHGWLNHVRSMFFTYVVLGIFHHRSPIWFQSHYPTVAHRTLALLASLCTSLLRIQEGGENSTMLTQPQFKAVFPELSKMNGFNEAKRLNQSWQVKPYALFSALFFLALCKTHRSVRNVVPPLFVEQLAFGICFFSTSRSPGSNQLQQDLLLDYRMTSVGHYLDHCRASHSDLDEQAHLTQLWPTIGAQPEDRELVRRVVFTAMTSTEHAGVKPLSSRTDLRALCKSLTGRYQHPQFEALSTNFDTSIRRMQDVLNKTPIVWSVDLGSTTTWFDQNATKKLEKAFHKQQSSITLNRQRFTYTLDTKNMTQTNQTTKKTRPIRPGRQVRAADAAGGAGARHGLHAGCAALCDDGGCDDCGRRSVNFFSGAGRRAPRHLAR